MKPKEELLFICRRAKICDSRECEHMIPHKFVPDNNSKSGCLRPTCGGVAVTCKPHNINENTKKQFAKFVAESRMK